MPVIRQIPSQPTDVLIAGQEMRSHAMLSKLNLGFEPMAIVGPPIQSLVISGSRDNPGEQLLVERMRPRSATHWDNTGSLVYNNSVISTPCGALIPVFGVQRFMDKPFAANLFTITGVTRDNVGAILGSCEVYAFDRWSMEMVGSTVSDGSGNYSIVVPSNRWHFIVSYLDGAPDKAGTTSRELTPS